MRVTGIVLAGGKSSRMGQDKAFLPWKGKPFVQHVIEAAHPLCDALLISGNQPELHIFGYPVVADLREGEGPVTALASCFEHVKTDLALVLSCDVPQIKTEDLELLIASRQDQNDVTLYTYQGRQMPLVAVYNKSSFLAFELAFKTQQRKLFDVLSRLRVVELTFTGNQGLENINTLNDYATL